MKEIKRVAVLGSGVMGAAIAAHMANCGIPSVMLDIVTPNLSEEDKKNKKKRNSLVEGNKAALLKAKPAPLFVKSGVEMIDTGNFDDNMDKIADCDLIIEVVMERLDVKKTVFEKVAQHRKPGSIVTSNTSGIRMKDMAAFMPKEMSEHFMGTHFFNPPRYLKLLELIPGPDTLPEVIETMAWFGENVLGKGIVYAKDTPNFCANRIITFAMQYLMHEMTKEGLTPEEVDALTGPAIGHASSATFRTCDLVGLDTFQKVALNVYNGCPDDEWHDIMKGPDWYDAMVEKKYWGNKSGSGFYKKTAEKDEKGKAIIYAIDPATVEYRPPVKAKFDCTGAVRSVEDLTEKFKIMLFSEDKGSKFLFKFFANLCVYAANRIPEISDDIVNIDNAVRWGFAWETGIFDTWDMLGFEDFAAKMEAAGIKMPPLVEAMRKAGAKSFYKLEKGVEMFFDLASKSYKPVKKNPKEVKLASIKNLDKSKVLASNDSASIIDIGDGVINVEFHCKMNAIDGDMILMLNKGVDLLDEGKYDGMVIGNQGPHFCAGANLFMLLGEIMQENWANVEAVVKALQDTGARMKYCSKPIVAAPHHYTFGGGVEICMHTDKCVISGETYAGLVEVGVGLLPAGGGTKEMLVRALEYIPANVSADAFQYVRRAFEAIATAKVGTSAGEFIELGYLRPTDIIEPNFELQLGRAKNVVLGMLQMGYRAPRPPRLWALGESIEAAFNAGVWGMNQAGWASEHDMIISGKIAHVLAGGDRIQGMPVTEQDILDLEREAFCSLCGMEKTQARMQHMLASGKPLRN
ncbi:MAG TPA: 3-hydroxyacyl-CoA dehydrogenase/enoyl-CoA hydratase family protein [Candidatus Hydrogenedentes bacterium]|nr:3-hydroxyacyl-CoA dehydrogenase/enoyl-CoA hydratase family protein [Candidatus Hydrogenedentota bacterium]